VDIVGDDVGVGAEVGLVGDEVGLVVGSLVVGGFVFRISVGDMVGVAVMTRLGRFDGVAVIVISVGCVVGFVVCMIGAFGL